MLYFKVIKIMMIYKFILVILQLGRQVTFWKQISYSYSAKIELIKLHLPFKRNNQFQLRYS